MYRIILYFRDGTVPVRGCPHVHSTREKAEEEYKRYENSSYDVEMRDELNDTIKWTNINWLRDKII